MSYDEQSFRNEQPVLATLFSRSKEESRLSHAYLLFGEPSSPVLESALYLAKSLECTKGTFACNKCSSCIRFEEGNHPDFLMIDGSKGLIKKGDIDEITDFTSMSSLEKGHQSVYIINHIENITEEAINALLKTLEEPSGNTIAFLTTTNKDKVLPTILSRCEQVMVRSPDLLNTIANYHGAYSPMEYYIVCNLAYSEKDRDDILESKEFSSAYESALAYLDALKRGDKNSSYFLMKEGGDVLKGNKCYNYFYTVLSIVFSDTVSGNNLTPFKYVSLALADKGNVLVKAIKLLGSAISKSQANMNFTFMLARLGQIMEGR